MTKKVEKAEIETSGLGTACVGVARRGFVRSGASLLLKGTQSCAGKNRTMKKLMFAAAVAACATVGLAEGEIVSANIVGYNTIEADATDGESAYQSIAMTFVPVSGDGFTLKDFKPVEGTFSPDDDNIQVIDPNTLDATSLFAYCDATKAAKIAKQRGGEAADYIGWWDLLLGDMGEEGCKADDYPVNVGDAFLGFFFGGNKVQFICSGEAPTKSTTITTAGGESYYQMIGNYIPKDLKLKQIVPQDGTFSPDDDNLQVIDPITLDATSLFAYCDATKAAKIAKQRGGEAADYIGWWDLLLGDMGEEGCKADDYPVKAGAGFMGFFFSEQKVTFQFPSSLDTVD